VLFSTRSPPHAVLLVTALSLSVVVRVLREGAGVTLVCWCWLLCCRGALVLSPSSQSLVCRGYQGTLLGLSPLYRGYQGSPRACKERDLASNGNLGEEATPPKKRRPAHVLWGLESGGTPAAKRGAGPAALGALGAW
jgi:hypothetical protein